MDVIRVLYVDDEPDLLELGKLFLEQEGKFSVDTVTSAQGAFELLASKKFDAIISDYLMPGMDGIGFLRSVRSSGNQIPFILFTGRGREEVVIQALNEGADFYLQKGGDPTPQFTELSHKIRLAVQKRRADRLLAESQAQLRAVVDSIPVGILTIDAETHRILSANQKAMEMIGADPGEIVGHICHRFICPSQAGACPVLDLGQGADLAERVLIRRSGEKIPILKSVVPTVMDGRDVLIESFFDISARQKVEAALRESDERFRQITENITAVFYIYERPSGRFVYISPAYEQVWMRSCQSLLDNPYSYLDAVHPDDLPALMASIRNDLEKDTFVDMEYRIIRPDGSVRWIHSRNFPVRNEAGVIYRVAGLAEDITDLKISRSALETSEERFRSLVETSPDMIWEVDTEGRFRYMSPTVTAIMGYTPEEILGMSILDLVPEGKKDAARQVLGRMVSPEGTLSPFEVSARHRDGHELILEIRPARVTGSDRQLQGLRGVAVDITERRKAEDALRMANHQLSTLSGITRHDILNKVSTILGFLKIADVKCGDPDVSAYLQKIYSATTQIQAEIEFTRIYQDLGAQKPRWIDLETVIPRFLVPATITLETTVTGVRVYADPMLERVFFNLLDNAVRHGERVTAIRVSCHVSGEDLVVVWEDNGIGIPADEKERIFERGFGKNTGLGMFLAREILALTGTTITETGEPGRGARFEIRVPKGAFQVAGV